MVECRCHARTGAGQVDNATRLSKLYGHNDEVEENEGDKERKGEQTHEPNSSGFDFVLGQMINY